MNFFDPNSKLMRALAAIFDLFVLGLLWVFLSFTIIGLGPACTALYYAVAKSVRKGRGNAVKEFLTSLKQNWWQSLAIGLLLTVLGFAVYFYDWNYIVVLITTGTSQNVLLTALAFLKVMLILGATIYVFPIISRFNTKIPKAILTSLALTLRHFLVTLYTVLLLICSIILALAVPGISWLIPGMFTWLLSVPMEAVLRKYTSSDDNPDSDQWYLEK